MQSGKGGPGHPAGPAGVDWLHLATYESLCEDIGTQQVHAAGAVIIGYVIDNTTSNKPVLGELLPGTMLWKKSANSEEITPVECSFLIVDSARRAIEMFKAYMNIGHKRLAKIYFTAQSKNINEHVVCYEKLTSYPITSQNVSMPKGKRTWQLTTRLVFEAIHESLKAGYGRFVFGCPENSNYLFYGKDEDNYGFPHMQKTNNADIIKFISVVPLKKINDVVRIKQLTDILDLFGNFGAKELDDEYCAFRSLVKERKSYNMPVLLGHPFPLCSERERVDVVEALNEEVHHLDQTELKRYETYMSQKLPGLNSTWKKKITEKGFSRMVNDLGRYNNSYKQLLKFLRDFITHQRDAALRHDINYGDLHASVYQPFGTFLSWTYTYIHKNK